MLKFGEERMKITLILFVYVILSSKWFLKKPFFDEKGVKIQKFEKLEKLPFRNTFGPILMKIVACR